MVLGSDRKHYRVLDMDFKARKEGGDDGVDMGDAGESSESEGGGNGDRDVEMGGA